MRYSRLKDTILVGTGILFLLVLTFLIGFHCYTKLPVVIRGFYKYGIVMKAVDVLKLETLEK